MATRTISCSVMLSKMLWLICLTLQKPTVSVNAQMLTILCGDAIEKLRELPAESVHCCVTSPPYWGLRDYSTNGQIGLEKTPEEYVAKMVEVFREVRRVLRKDGTLWLNLGSSMAASGGQGEEGSSDGATGRGPRSVRIKSRFKPKDMIPIPWMVAMALQSDGWYLRQDIIWAKPNPMPESVTDRCTKAHEYMFLLTKSARYYFDQEAIREPHTAGNIQKQNGELRDRGDSRQFKKQGLHDFLNPAGRNKRSVWTVATAPYPEAHFATYPPDLIKPCIMAGTSAKGCCAKCGAPWERVVEKGESDLEHQRACGGDSNGEYLGKSKKDYGSAKAQNASETKSRILRGMTKDKTLGWQPTCECGDFVSDAGDDYVHKEAFKP